MKRGVAEPSRGRACRSLTSQSCIYLPEQSMYIGRSFRLASASGIIESF
jgi:hypothetical protein